MVNPSFVRGERPAEVLSAGQADLISSSCLKPCQTRVTARHLGSAQVRLRGGASNTRNFRSMHMLASEYLNFAPQSQHTR